MSSRLHQTFGFDSFRAGQEEAIQALLNKRHTLAIMPTGAGKSLIFQYAALQLEGITLVISPLIALMKDQVDALNRRGISATYINSAIPVSEQKERLALLSQGKYKLIYVAPERLRNVTFLQALQSLTLSLLTVDEAHCVSEWGHDFRPDYLHIAEARRKLNDPLTVALTATATPKVQSDIVRLLGLPESTLRIVTGFNRPNLTLEVKYTADTEAKFRELSELLRTSELNSDIQGATLIYTGTRLDAEEVAEFVRALCKLKADYYHAGLLSEDRARIQEAFINGTLPVIVATNAFGMGIDRADVRQVIHYSLPGSLEAYYQEAGRAGRDGLPAKAILLYDPQDRALQEFFITNGIISVEELGYLYRALGNMDNEIWMTTDEFSRRTDLHQVKVKVGLAELERIGALEHLGDDGFRMLLKRGKWNPAEVDKAAARSKEHTKHREDQLQHMVNYAETNACRRRIILKHFGDVGNADALVCCDNCRSVQIFQQQSATQTQKSVDKFSRGERAALVILDAVRRLKNHVGREKLAQILKGSKSKALQKLHYEQSAYYAKLGTLRKQEIEGLLEQLIVLDYLKIVGGNYPVVALTPRGENAIKQKVVISLEISKSAASPKHLKTWKSGTPDISIDRIVELGESKSPDSIPELIHALENENGNIRRLAASALGKLRDARAVGPLLNLLEHENKPQVRQYAVKALGSISDVLAIELLTKISEDKNEMYYTRDSAKVAIRRCRMNLSSNMTSQPRDSSTLPTPSPSSSDTITEYLSTSHPRPLTGSWHTGFALDFHSSYKGADWNRSAIGDLVYRLKYQSDSSTLSALIEHTQKLFAAHPEISEFDIILPVPSSTPREFSPVHEFCKSLSRAVNKPAQESLTKTRQTRPQKEMHTLPQKRDNVAGAFALNSDITGKRVLIVDDLFDSGATLEEITKLLLKYKASRVNVLTLTRTIHADA